MKSFTASWWHVYRFIIVFPCAVIFTEKKHDFTASKKFSETMRGRGKKKDPKKDWIKD